MKNIRRGFRRFVTVGLSLLLIAVPCVIFGVLKETGERELFIAYLGLYIPLLVLGITLWQSGRDRVQEMLFKARPLLTASVFHDMDLLGKTQAQQRYARYLIITQAHRQEKARVRARQLLRPDAPDPFEEPRYAFLRIKNPSDKPASNIAIRFQIDDAEAFEKKTLSIDGFCENFIYLPIAKTGTGWSFDVVTADILYHTAAGETVDYHYELRLREETVIHRYRAQYKGKATYSLDFATDYYRNDYPGS